ncbi:sigma-E factor negative regulatory protein [Undibacterium sp. TJN19]|uniref:sigma-E factor negative regulatory protein n=1 Tax=Undibacterium sp. TJN19 TaxID=3413055 RepID=UPI003BF1FE72
MNKSANQHESISAMADGELSDAQLDSLLASLNDAESKDAWEIYHQIGDVLRSDELAITFSADFSKKFSEKLDAEPVILAPKASVNTRKPENERKQKFLGSYVAVASAAAAAVFAFLLAPQLQIFQANSGAPVQLSSKAAPASNVQLASHSDGAPLTTLAVNSQGTPEHSAQAGEKVATESPDMLRDPRIDSYLLAHQRFSPAINSGAPYVTRANAVSSASEK